MDVDSGDKVLVITDQEKIEGVLMPQKGSFVVVKLDNGYNIGIDRKKVKEIKLVDKKDKKKPKKKEIPQDKKLKTISILQTGGTIASRVDYETGGVKADFSPEELLALFPELEGMANIRFRFLGNLLSENLRFEHYNFFAESILKEIEEGTDGIIMLHGTDTMHYTAAALSFMIEDLPVPIILVGSQRSSDRGSSDATMNLVSAALFCTNTDFAEVAICMHENSSDDSCVILSGTKARKMHTSRRDAFRAINSLPIARVSMKDKRVDLLRKSYAKRSKKVPRIKKFKEDIKVGMLYAHPHMYADQFSAFKGYDGLVLISTGLGHLPVVDSDRFTKENARIADSLEELAKKTVLVLAPQTLYGRLRMTVYSTSRMLDKIGVIGDLSDMTPETTFIKLAWLLSFHKREDVEKLMLTDLRGELSVRSEQRNF